MSPGDDGSLNNRAGWLFDCMLKDPAEIELLLLGSDALHEAGKVHRDRVAQAIMKVDTSFDIGKSVQDALECDQCKFLIAALGVGVSVPESHNDLACDLTRLRYGKVIIVAEPYEAGLQIRSQVLRFLSTYMRPVVSAGHVFFIDAPPEPGFQEQEFIEKVLNPATRHLRLVG